MAWFKSVHFPVSFIICMKIVNIGCISKWVSRLISLLKFSRKILKHHFPGRHWMPVKDISRRGVRIVGLLWIEGKGGPNVRVIFPTSWMNEPKNYLIYCNFDCATEEKKLWILLRLFSFFCFLTILPCSIDTNFCLWKIYYF